MKPSHIFDLISKPSHTYSTQNFISYESYKTVYLL